jgi:hypothetical protein
MSEVALFDLEPLPAMTVAVHEAGLSIEAMTGGLVRFVRNLEEATSGSSSEDSAKARPTST